MSESIEEILPNTKAVKRIHEYMDTKLQIIHDDKPALQMANIGDMKQWYNDFVAFSKEILKADLDYGTIPGVAKPSLFKPGAEKLRFVYGLGVEMIQSEKVVDLDGHYVSYTYKCSVRSKAGQLLAECEGNCNSYESKYRYTWVKEDEIPYGVDKSTLRQRPGKITEFDFAVTKAETTGTYGKPAEYWQKFQDAISNGTARRIVKTTKTGKQMDAWEIGSNLYRTDNEDVVGLQNTIMKMAQKRAFVGAILIATGASEFFTQDVEDLKEFADVADVSDTPKKPAPPASEGEVLPEEDFNAVPNDLPETRVFTPAEDPNLASDAQRKMFFALGSELHIESDRLKEKAKKKFDLESFTTISKAQLAELINSLDTELTEREQKRDDELASSLEKINVSARVQRGEIQYDTANLMKMTHKEAKELLAR